MDGNLLFAFQSLTIQVLEAVVISPPENSIPTAGKESAYTSSGRAVCPGSS